MAWNKQKQAALSGKTWISHGLILSMTAVDVGGKATSRGSEREMLKEAAETLEGGRAQ
jgi:hypothetical protein